MSTAATATTTTIAATVAATVLSGKKMTVADQLGDRMKGYEKVYEMRVPNDHVMLIRLDGLTFETWTRGLDAVFDLVFTRSMILTMNDLLLKFHPQTGYTHSDEITLVFAPHPKPPKRRCSNFKDANDSKIVGTDGLPMVGTLVEPEDIIIGRTYKDTKSDGMPSAAREISDPCDLKTQEWMPHLYSGRVEKLVSVMASYATARFNAHFEKQMQAHPKGHYGAETYDKLHKAAFDGRILSFPQNLRYEVANHMLWRSTFDCHRNCVSAFMRAFVSAKKLHKVDCKTMIQLMQDQHKFNFNNVPIFLKHGTFAKFTPKSIILTALTSDVVKKTKTMPVNNEKEKDHDNDNDDDDDYQEENGENTESGGIENRCGRVYCSEDWVETLLAKTWLPKKLELIPNQEIHVPPFHINQIDLIRSLPPSILSDRDKTIKLILIQPPSPPLSLPTQPDKQN